MKKTIAAAALALLVAACGGGGDGGAPASGTQGTVGDNGTGLALTNVGPSRVQLELFEGEYVPDVSLSATLTGDIIKLNGKTLYLFAIVPDPLFRASPLVSIDPARQSATITLQGTIPPSGPKTYSNNITVRACLDAGCQTEIGNSNVSIPYTVMVKKGLTVPIDQLELKTTFGTSPASATVPVGLPDGAVSWTVDATDGPPSWSSTRQSPAISAVKTADGSGIVVSPKRLYEANSSIEATIRLSTTISSGKTLSFVLPVSYKTAASAVPYVLSQTHSKISVKVNTPYLVGDDVVEFYSAEDLAPLKPKYMLLFKGNEFIQKPANASFAGYPAYSGGWLFGTIGRYPYPARWNVQAQACYMTNCLPAGHYTVISRYAVSTDGINELEVLTYSVELDILP